MINESSICIVLEQYKKNHITIEEAIQLIEDLYKGNSNTFIYPSYPTWPQITYDTNPNFQKYEITCNLKENGNN